MKKMFCLCGQVVYFDNHSCNSCGRQLAFDPGALSIWAEEYPGSGLNYCVNRASVIRCNWTSDSGVAGGACLSCRMSQIIPSLSKPENRERWRKLEAAKRRLIVDLLRLKLPVNDSELRFVFKEDRRTNPSVYDAHVSTGHAQGVITINAAEADDVFREHMRQQMNEPNRTLLGHFRHECGHYYFGVVLDEEQKAQARTLFGDERSDYAQALEEHYRDGPPPRWDHSFISSYASAHPAEDWAECWAHYLHIRAALEAAEETGLRVSASPENWRNEFIELAVSLNEILRSLGLPDAYPFVLTGPIGEKINFVHQAVMSYQVKTVAG